MLNQFFKPKSIAIIGATGRPNSVGLGLMKSLLKGGVFSSPTNRPFKGKVFPINPNLKKVMGKKCYASVLEIKGKIDLVIIAVPAKIVPIVIEQCAKKKVKGVIIISAGFGEMGEAGKKLEEQILSTARRGGIRIIGPNCLGIMRPSDRLNATFGPCLCPEGDVAFFSQSGALIDSVVDWSLEKKYGFSAVVSLGNSIDLDVSDFLAWAKTDKKTKAITLYLEGLSNGKRFMKTAYKISKPIIAIKAGRTATGIKAVSSHTGSLAGSYEIYQAAFRQAGIHSADNMEEMFDLAKALAFQPVCKENRIAIITNGGGAGVLCTDHCEKNNILLSPLTKATLAKLDNSGKMHPAYSRSNPLDLVGDAPSDRYAIAINTVLQQKDVHGVIVMQTLQTMTEPVANAKILIQARKKYPNKPIIACFMGGKFSKKAVELLEVNKIPNYDMPFKAVNAMKALIDEGK